MDIQKYILDNAVILIPVLYFIGTLLKNTPKVSDWVIPYILVVLGIIGGLTMVSFDVLGVIQGILVAGTTVLGNQLVVQTTNRN